MHEHAGTRAHERASTRARARGKGSLWGPALHLFKGHSEVTSRSGLPRRRAAGGGPKHHQMEATRGLRSIGPEPLNSQASSGPLGPRASFCSQSVLGGQWLFWEPDWASHMTEPCRGRSSRFLLSNRFSGIFSLNSPDREIRTGAEVGVLSGTTGSPGVPLQHLLRVPRKECELQYNSTPLADICLLAVAAGSRGKGISVPQGEQPLPQKRVVLSRTLHTAAPPQRLRTAQPHREAKAHCLCLPPV